MKELLHAELKAYVEEGQKDLIALLDTLCRIPSPSRASCKMARR